ncbi:hypothetical protein [Azonexus sp. R2A61]|uniref:hypothetical protein n=1 Tax=Azonexus sp. R2A61 TaxID=2744443 RepID=UPI001F44D4B8|nr:hypothetical protein [Azonexus sp. R2A61]
MTIVSRIVGSAVRASALLIVATLTACSNNCSDDDPALTAVANKASQGDITAIATLYERYATYEKIPPLADYWLFRGAVAGDPELRRKHIAAYRANYSPERQARELEVLKTEPQTPAVLCLISALKNPEGNPNACRS